MKIKIEHRNRLDAAIDERLVRSTNERTIQAHIKAALLEMIEENVIDPGDYFIVIEDQT
jgi:hypothetical protein